MLKLFHETAVKVTKQYKTALKAMCAHIDETLSSSTLLQKMLDPLCGAKSFSNFICKNCIFLLLLQRKRNHAVRRIE